MSHWITNARMYAVTPEVEADWRFLLERMLERAGLADGPEHFSYMPYPAPQPMEVLWARRDLGCVFMCGYPIALRLADVVPIAAPIPAADWAGGRPLYRTDLIVRRDSTYRTLADTFGHRLGWTVEHSHSGFNALRHHLLAYRTPERPTLYGAVTGHLVTARAVLDAVRAGLIDVGPLDGYWHALIRRHRPDLTDDIRVIDVTDTAPIPCFVAHPAMPVAAIDRMKMAFTGLAAEPWFSGIADRLLISGFAAVDRCSFATTLRRDEAAKAAGYAFPA